MKGGAEAKKKKKNQPARAKLILGYSQGLQALSINFRHPALFVPTPPPPRSLDSWRPPGVIFTSSCLQLTRCLRQKPCPVLFLNCLYYQFRSWTISFSKPGATSPGPGAPPAQRKYSMNMADDVSGTGLISPEGQR